MIYIAIFVGSNGATGAVEYDQGSSRRGHHQGTIHKREGCNKNFRCEALFLLVIFLRFNLNLQLFLA